MFSKGDVTLNDWLLECKTKTSPSQSISIKKEWLEKNEEEAFYMCQQVMDKVRKHGGELVLLWHNSNITEDTYLKTLYADIIDYLNQTTL